jgi:hypothetical protein
MPFGAEMCDKVVDLKPDVVSFHFGLPETSLVDRIKAAGCIIFSSATTVAEAPWLEDHGADAVIAQGAGFDGVDGEFVKDAKDARGNSVGYSHEMTQALRGQDGGAFERQAAQDRGDHFLKLFVTFPTWQDELVEPTRQLDVAGNRIARICDAQADQRCLELIAEMTEQLEDDPLFARATGEKVVNFVEDQHAHH